MILTDTDIRQRLSTSSTSGFDETAGVGQWANSDETILVYPFEEAQLTPVGYDLRVGAQHLSLKRKKEFELGVGQEFSIEPGETLLVSTEEYIGLPKHNQTLVGIIESKVSLVSLGLSHVSTTVDPDWEGHLLVALTNHQSFPIKLIRRQPFCTLMFIEVKTKATKQVGRPPGRSDIILERIRAWRQAAEDAQRSLLRRMLPLVGFIAVVVVLTAVAYLVFGSTEGFSGWAAVTIALASVVFSEIRRGNQ